MPFDGTFSHPKYGEVKYRGSFGKLSLEEAQKIFDFCMDRPDNPPSSSPINDEGSCETFDQEHQLNNLIGMLFDSNEEFIKEHGK